MPKITQHENKCELFGAFGFFVQFFLGFISFASLIGNSIKTIINFLITIISEKTFRISKKIY